MQPELKPYASLAYSNEDTIQNTHDLALRAIRNNIEGDFVECGVAAGAQIGVMGYICQATGSNKKIYAYDIIRGIEDGIKSFFLILRAVKTSLPIN
jgi:hypothetical protein